MKPVLLVSACVLAAIQTASQAIIPNRRPPAVQFEQPAAGVFPSPDRPVAPPRTVNTEALRAIEGSAQRPFKVSLDESSGIARTITQGLSRAYGPDAATSARAFISDAASLLGPQTTPEALRLVGTAPTAFGTQVRFQQTVDGVPILSREVSVNLTQAGEVLDVENTTAPISGVITTPSVSALAVAGMAKGRIIKYPSLAVDPNAPEPRLVWRMVYTSAPDQVIRLTVDALTGNRLQSENLIQTYVTGSGKVYTGNPVSTPMLTSQPLPWLLGSGYLSGQFAKVYRDPPPGTQDVNEPSLVFNYAPGDVRLAETQAYYGITAIHDYFKGNLGFTGRDASAMPAYVHVDGMDNAFYSGTIGTSGGMEFGYYQNGPYEVEYALDCDVLYHEYTHAVVDKVASAFSDQYDSYHEQGGINEGFADYFSCSKLNDPVLAEYALGTAYGRDLRNRNHFPEDLPLPYYDSPTQRSYQTFPEVHRTGETWGPVCWDLRQALGQTKADTLLFKALSLFTATTLMQDALNKIITADSQIYAGANAATIRRVFNARGIYEAVYPVKYLDPTSFYSTTGTSKVKTGDVYTDGVYFYDPYYFVGYGIFPAIVADRWYCLTGYTEDSTVSSVFVILKNSSGGMLAYSGNNTAPLSAITSSGAKAYRSITTWYKFPASLISASQKLITGRIAIQCYTQSAAVVSAAFATTPLTARSIAPTSPSIYTAQLLKVRRGDVNTDGAINIVDAILALRSVTGKDPLTDVGAVLRAPQGDIVAPFTGKPDIADVKQMLKVAAGLA